MDRNKVSIPFAVIVKPLTTGPGFKTRMLNPKPRSRNRFGMTEPAEPNHSVTLNLFGKSNGTDKGPVTSLNEAVIFFFLFSPFGSVEGLTP
jgi:hypothetical protein